MCHKLGKQSRWQKLLYHSGRKTRFYKLFKDLNLCSLFIFLFGMLLTILNLIFISDIQQSPILLLLLHQTGPTYCSRDAGFVSLLVYINSLIVTFIDFLMRKPTLGTQCRSGDINSFPFNITKHLDCAALNGSDRLKLVNTQIILMLIVLKRLTL